MKKILKTLCLFSFFLLFIVFGLWLYSPCAHTELSSLKVEPTCEKQGYTLWTCTSCNYSYQTDFVPTTEHIMVDNIVAPTCASEGYHLHTCKTCDESYKTEILSATGHTLTPTASVASCTAAGYTQFTCSNCDLTYYTDITPPLGHDFYTTDCIHPTISEAGKLTQGCARCEQTFSNPLNYNDVFTNAYVSHNTILAKGIDVSYHNHTAKNTEKTEFYPLDWNTIREAGFDFAILRAGYFGTKDLVFEMNYADAKAAGIELGVYYYSYAKNAEQAKEEAEELIGWLQGKQFEYPIYYDMEAEILTSIDKDTLTECCITFIDTLRKAGYYSALYSNHRWLKNYLEETTLKEYGELWYARYQRDPAGNTTDFFIPADDDNFTWLPSYGAQVGMWQYTQYGVIEGIDGVKFDFNYVYKDYPSMIKKFCFNGFEALVPS